MHVKRACVAHALFLEQRAADVLEAALGWSLFTEGEDKLGWLMNFTTVSQHGGAAPPLTAMPPAV